MNKQAAKIAIQKSKREVYIQKLRIGSYRNHSELELDFNPGINCLYGLNGAGKTNVLDALYFLGNGRSYFTRSDVNNIPFDTSAASWHLDYQLDDQKHKHEARLSREGGKTIERNGAVVKKLSDFITHLPMVMITPGDIRLVTGSGDERRRLMDRCISLYDQQYLKNIQKYTKLMASRNQSLRIFAERRYVDDVLLDTIDQQLCELSPQIVLARTQFSAEFNARVSDIYRELSDDAEVLEVEYLSEFLNTDHSAILASQRHADIRAQRTTSGLHRDDLEVCLDGMPARKFASQGQIKSLTISMNLGVYKLLGREMNRIPILLLDDVFEKIDELRSRRLMELIAGSEYGQIFITDTSVDRMKSRLNEVSAVKNFFNIERRKKVVDQAD